jgi:hypothetical protein
MDDHISPFKVDKGISGGDYDYITNRRPESQAKDRCNWAQICFCPTGQCTQLGLSFKARQSHIYAQYGITKGCKTGTQLPGIRRGIARLIHLLHTALCHYRTYKDLKTALKTANSDIFLQQFSSVYYCQFSIFSFCSLHSLGQNWVEL